MMKFALASSALALMWPSLIPASANAAPLFVSGSTFTVSANNSPDSYTNTVTLNLSSTPVTTLLDGGAVSLSQSIVSSGANEWLVFNYSTTSSGPFSCAGCYWSLNQIGLDVAAGGAIFNAAYSQFNVNGVAQTPTYAFFPGYGVETNPVPGATGTGMGASGFNAVVPAGPLGALGAFIDPWDGYLNSAGINALNVNGYEQALEFSPSATPLPAALPLFASGLGALGLFGWRRKRKNAAATAAA